MVSMCARIIIAAAEEGAEMGESAENLLVERACMYLTRGEYPLSATQNEKRSIRRKAKKLVVRKGEVYVHKNGKEVNSHLHCSR